MASSWRLLLIIPLLFLIFFLQLPCLRAGASSNLVEHVCRSHDDYNFCTAALGSDPGSGSADLPGLGFISFGLVKDNVTDTTLFIREELEREIDAQKKKSLNECLQVYREAAEDTEDGRRALEAKNYQQTTIEALAVGSAAEGCDRAVGGPAGGSPLGLRDRNLNRLSEIAWIIAVMLR